MQCHQAQRVDDVHAHRSRRGLVIGLLMLLLLGLSVVAATAQLDEDPCREACRAAHTQCVNLCSEHGNPMECESSCREQAEECERSCSPYTIEEERR